MLTDDDEDYAGSGPALGPEEGGLVDAVMESRLSAVVHVARYHGVELDRTELRLVPGAPLPSPADLVVWLRASGLWAQADHLKWRTLLRINTDDPVILLFNDGSAAIMTGVDLERGVVFLRDPRGTVEDVPVPVDETRIRQVWSGESILIRPERTEATAREPFTFGWIFKVVLRERGLLREIGFAGVVIAIVSVIPVLFTMVLIDQVMAHEALNTLYFVTDMILLLWLSEAVLTYTQQNCMGHLGVRLDTRLNLHLFSRLLGLPIDYYEQNPAGRTHFRLQQIWRVRGFITGNVLSLTMQIFQLLIILPILFYISSELAWYTLAASFAIALIIFAFLPSIRRFYKRVVAADAEKNTVLIETVHGIRTVKSLALEPQQRRAWDSKVAEATDLRLRAMRLGAWPGALIIPFQRFTERGVMLLGGFIMLSNPGTITLGSIVIFMILGSRVSGPFVSFVRFFQDLEEIRAAVHEIQIVLDTPPEVENIGRGLRPTFRGEISFDDLTFTYPMGKSPAIRSLTADIPAGTMMGLVGRSGSGKSTIARLLQGINRTYEGYLKIDGVELREVNLAHLRRSFGVVLQDNFLFRGTIRDNIIASRPGLGMEEVVRACRLAGAEEFIERMPEGYDTFIEEGSPNVSGGQRQRLAIARALASDPRLLILDEATSALDPESEALVNANLRRIAHGRTMVIVSHRLASLLDCDLTMVLDRGRLIDLAPHAVLLERCEIYRTLWFQQNRHLTHGAANALPAPDAAAQGN